MSPLPAAAQPLSARSGRGGRFGLVAAGLGLFSLVSVFWACLLGALAIPAGQVLAILLQAAGLHGAAAVPEGASVAVLDLRLARACLAWLVGCGLGAAGAAFQGLLRNPLADSFTLGVSGGAAFGATLAISLGLGAAEMLPALGVLPLAGLCGAGLALCAVIGLAKAGGGLRRESLVLAGIVVATFLSALISLVKALDEESVASIVFWIMRSLQGRGWPHVVLYLPWFCLGLTLLFCLGRELDILCLGETQARQLGLHTGRSRLLVLTGAGLLTGAAVAVSGVIGFVGLVVPHLCRMLQGAEHRPLLLSSGLLGGALLLWADVLARTILPGGAELPAGVVTALVGGPFFCLLLRRRLIREAR